MFNYSCFKNKWINVINTLDPKSSTDGAKTLQQKRSVQRLQTNRAFIFSRTKPPVRPTKRCSYIQTRQVVVLTCDLSLSLSRSFSLRETLRWSWWDSLFFHAYFWSTQLCWTEIGSWAFSLSEQEVGAGRHRAGSLPLPDDSPGSLPSV